MIFATFALIMMKRFFIYLLVMASVPSVALPQEVYAGNGDSTVLVVPYKQLVETRLDALMDDSLLETSQLGLMVWDLTTDSMLYERNARQRMRPASTMKLLTAISALDRLGGDYNYTTSLYYRGIISQGTLRGDLVCVGGMDPMFDMSDMRAFVKSLKELGVKRVEGRIVSDVTMKDGDKWGDGWCWDDDNPTLSPLLCGRKSNFAEQLLKELKAQRITTSVSTVKGTLQAGSQLVCVRRHVIGEVLLEMMKESNNLYAESTFYQVAASTGHRQSTAKDARQVESEVLAKAGVDATLCHVADGSGLSLYNYLSAEALTMLLRYAWFDSSIYDHLLPTLPVAGEDGTLEKRMRETAAYRNVQAKTGTVTGISSLAGYCTAPNGHRICFAIINQGVRRSAEGRSFQDRVCQALCQP